MYPNDHFYKQFDRYEEGQKRFEAAARHAAHLLNSLGKRQDNELAALATIRDALISGVNTAKIALAIQARMEDEFDAREGRPTLHDLVEPAATQVAACEA